jgi:hypothetical protein
VACLELIAAAAADALLVFFIIDVRCVQSKSYIFCG